MADFAPPSGPPPPKVPAGWKAVWNDQYKEWFYVNTVTKKSQWDKPTEPVYGDEAPAGPPPGYDQSSRKPTGPEKSSNPYGGPANNASINDDEALARRLQAEESAKAGSSTATRGAADSYFQGGGAAPAAPYGQQSNQYNQNNAPAYGQATTPVYGQGSSPAPGQQDEKRGLFSKLTGKLGGGGSRPPQQGYGGYQQQPYGQQPYGQQYPPQGYGGYPPQQQYYPPQQGGYGQQPPRRQGGGLGGAGGAVLGAGAGLVGGMLLMDAIDDHNQEEYQEGFQNGQAADDGGYGGDDGGYGGDDGGDF